MPYMVAMHAPEIIRIPILPFGMVNAHAIRTADGCILIDAGIPGSEAKIGRALARHGLSYSDIKLIVVTHAHTDHAGCAAILRKLSGAPILAHENDLEFYNRSRPMTFCPSSWVGRLFLKTPVPHTPYEAFEPDIMMTDGQNVGLAEFGVDGFVRHTAGHTPGSVVVELASDDVMVGDLLASGILIGGIALTGRAISPPFEDDPHTIGLELQRLVDGGAKRFYMGHGGPLGAAEVQRHARRLSKMAPVSASVSASCAAGNCGHASH
jgi:hydroxyacylglutathione hydrolase